MINFRTPALENQELSNINLPYFLEMFTNMKTFKHNAFKIGYQEISLHLMTNKQYQKKFGRKFKSLALFPTSWTYHFY